MNNKILKQFNKIHKSSQLSILPHQLGTIDFLLDRVVDKGCSVLVYHKTGSGKTTIGTGFSILATLKKEKVMIILSNQSLMEIWKDHQPLLLSLLPSEEYNLDDIIFETKINFMKKILTDDDNKLINVNKIKQYDNFIFIIDEAHNIFDNDVGKNFQELKSYINIRFVFLSGSPVTNTPDKIINIIELIDTKLENNIILGKGKYVYDRKILKDKLPLIEKKVENKVSYYIQNATDIPKGEIEGYKVYQFPIIPCKMTKLQEEYYYKTAKKEKNLMFSRQVLNASFASLGYSDYSENSFKTYGKEKEILENLTVNNEVFKGQELYDLNFSSKIKMLVNTIKEDPCKRLIYFSNSSIGTMLLKSILPVHGLTEYFNKPSKDFLCIKCKFRKECKECIPVRYIIITSKEISLNNININKILTVFNDVLNKDGRNLCLIFGSEVIEEGYTLKELKEIIFLTIPDSQSILVQVIGRGIRSWSHSEPHNSIVTIKIFVATTSKDKIEKYFSKEKKKIDIVSLEKTTFDKRTKNDKEYNLFKHLLDNDDNDLSFDFRKILYLNLKHQGTKEVHKLLKKASKEYNSYANDIIKKSLLFEYLRQYFYDNNVYSLTDNNNIETFFEDIMLIKKEEIKNCLNDSMIIYNKDFSYCNLILIKDDIVIYPFRLSLDNFLYKVTIKETDNKSNFSLVKKVGDFLLIYNKKENIYKIKLNTGTISNLTTLSKKKLKIIAKNYLNIDIDINNNTTSEIIRILIDKCKELNNNSNLTYYQEL